MANFLHQTAYDLRMNAAPELSPRQDAHACYQALKAHDARFDGRFFVGVSSTRIYCRPVCRVKLPKFENCSFFDHAALAESAGYRPCMRCRPELAPQSLPWTSQDASRTLALQAARWLDEPLAWGEASPSISRLAQHLGVSDRHVRRLFEAQFGVSPLQYLQTRRLLTAKQLLTDTDITHRARQRLCQCAALFRCFFDALPAQPQRVAKSCAQPCKNNGSNNERLAFLHGQTELQTPVQRPMDA
jgi:methylphosphotriester-DNA--protein-cysteine methyltransferase